MWLAIIITVMFSAIVCITYLAYRRDIAELKYAKTKNEKPYWWFEYKKTKKVRKPY